MKESAIAKRVARSMVAGSPPISEAQELVKMAADVLSRIDDSDGYRDTVKKVKKQLKRNSLNPEGSLMKFLEQEAKKGLSVRELLGLFGIKVMSAGNESEMSLSEVARYIMARGGVLAFKRTPNSPRPVSKRLSFPQVLQLAKKEAKKLRTTVYVIRDGKGFQIVRDDEYFTVYANKESLARVSQDGRIAKQMKAGMPPITKKYYVGDWGRGEPEVHLVVYAEFAVPSHFRAPSIKQLKRIADAVEKEMTEAGNAVIRQFDARTTDSSFDPKVMPKGSNLQVWRMAEFEAQTTDGREIIDMLEKMGFKKR